MKPITMLATGLILVLLTAAPAAFAAAAGSTRVDSGGGVTIKVTPLPSEAADEVRFQVLLDTHAVNLDAFDLKALSLLRDDGGSSYAPTRIENKGAGHHREITLVFPKTAASAKRLELIVKDVAGVKERSFIWDR